MNSSRRRESLSVLDTSTYPNSHTDFVALIRCHLTCSFASVLFTTTTRGCWYGMKKKEKRLIIWAADKSWCDNNNPTISRQQTAPSINGGKLLLSADAELSLYCPNPSSSLPSAPRHAAEASWNIWREGGKEEERGREMEGSGPIVFRVTSLFLSEPPEVCSLPSGCAS